MAGVLLASIPVAIAYNHYASAHGRRRAESGCIIHEKSACLQSMPLPASLPTARSNRSSTTMTSVVTERVNRHYRAVLEFVSPLDGVNGVRRNLLACIGLSSECPACLGKSHSRCRGSKVTHVPERAHPVPRLLLPIGKYGVPEGLLQNSWGHNVCECRPRILSAPTSSSESGPLPDIQQRPSQPWEE